MPWAVALFLFVFTPFDMVVPACGYIFALLLGTGW